MACLEPMAQEKALRLNVFWAHASQTAVQFPYLDVTHAKKDGNCFNLLAFNFRKVTISRKSKFQNYVKKPLAIINLLLTGKNFVYSLV